MPPSGRLSHLLLDNSSQIASTQNNSRPWAVNGYHSRDGRKKFEIADKLCWLSKECVLKKDRKKDGKLIPVVKNHLDVADTVVRQLEEQNPELAELLHDLVRQGVLFPLQSSRSRQGHDATRRYMVRRILLARYTTALGRDMPIRIDDMERMSHLLNEPQSFVEDELGKMSKRVEAERNQPLLPGFDD